MTTMTDTSPLTALAGKVDKQLLVDVFTTALEGGIGYWSTCTKYHWMLPGSDRNGRADATDFDGFYATIEVLDEAAEGVYLHTINADTIRDGLAKAAADAPTWRDTYQRNAVLDLLHGSRDADFDADTADLIVQYGLFGQQVYG